MRADKNLLREILEHVELSPQAEVRRMTVPARCPPGIYHWHMQLLIDGGCLSAQQLRPYGPAVAVGLTLAGQKLLDEFRATGDVARSVGAIATKIVASTAMGLLVAKIRAAGIEL